jgi:hypothetical protein
MTTRKVDLSKPLTEEEAWRLHSLPYLQIDDQIDPETVQVQEFAKPRHAPMVRVRTSSGWGYIEASLPMEPIQPIQ